MVALAAACPPAPSRSSAPPIVIFSRNEAIRRGGAVVILNEVKNLLSQQNETTLAANSALACPFATRHIPLPHTITSPYPVSMKAARKLPTLSHLHTSAFQTALPSPLSYLHNEHRRHHDDFRICFSYPINCWLVLALEFDITSETIRFETTPTGTNRSIVYTAGVPLLTPEPISSDRGSAQPSLRFVHHIPPIMVISAAVGSSARLSVCPPACLHVCSPARCGGLIQYPHYGAGILLHLSTPANA